MRVRDFRDTPVIGNRNWNRNSTTRRGGATRRKCLRNEAPAVRHAGCFFTGRMTTTPTFSDAVRAFKRQLLEAQLQQSAGNRTQAARALGLQRTYLLRLIRDLGVTVPPRLGRPRVTE